MSDWETFPSGPYFLTATIDTATMLKETRRARVRLIISLALTLTAIILGTIIMLSRARRRALQDALMLAHERTAQQEHLTHLGAGLAHETKNPLGIVRGLAQLIANSEATPEAHSEIRKHAGSIIDEVDRTIGQVNSFLALSRPKAVKLAPVNLKLLFDELAPLVASEAQQKKLKLSFVDAGFTVKADEDLLRRAILNLILNAFSACKPVDEIEVAAQRNGSRLSITVSDTGCGIAPEDIEQVTEPYFTRFEGGSGLGLSLVKQMAQAHGWHLAITSELGQGTRVLLRGIDEVK